MQRLLACNNHISDIPPHRWNKGTSTTCYADMLDEQRISYKATSLENLTSSPLITRLRRKTLYIYSPYNKPPHRCDSNATSKHNMTLFEHVHGMVWLAISKVWNKDRITVGRNVRVRSKRAACPSSSGGKTPCVRSS